MRGRREGRKEEEKNRERERQSRDKAHTAGHGPGDLLPATWPRPCEFYHFLIDHSIMNPSIDG